MQWKWGLIGLTVVTLLVLLGWWVWSFSRPNGSLRESSPAEDRQESIGELPNSGNRNVEQKSAPTNSALFLTNGEDMFEIPISAEYAEVFFDKLALPPVYDEDQDSWLLIEPNGTCHIAEWSEEEETYVIEPGLSQMVPIDIFEGVHVSYQHGGIVFCTSSGQLFYQGLQHGLSDFDEVEIPSGFTTSVILSDHQVILLNEETGTLSEVSFPAGYVQECKIEGIHSPKHLFKIPDTDGFVVSSANRSFVIHAEDSFQKVAVLDHPCSSLAVSSELFVVGDHINEQVHFYPRHEWERLSILNVPGGSHLQRFPPSGFGSQIALTGSSQIIVSAPYQHAIQSREEAGLVYVFFVEPETGTATPCRVLRSDNSLSMHFGEVLLYIKDQIWVYEDTPTGGVIKRYL